MPDRPLDNIRDPRLLGHFIGSRLVDITQTDLDELRRGEASALTFHFDNGYTIEVPVLATGRILSFEGPDTADADGAADV